MNRDWYLGFKIPGRGTLLPNSISSIPSDCILDDFQPLFPFSATRHGKLKQHKGFK
jgi:hypothetical protein